MTEYKIIILNYVTGEVSSLNIGNAPIEREEAERRISQAGQSLNVIEWMTARADKIHV